MYVLEFPLWFVLFWDNCFLYFASTCTCSYIRLCRGLLFLYSNLVTKSQLLSTVKLNIFFFIPFFFPKGHHFQGRIKPLRSPCDLIRPLRGYEDSLLFVHIFPPNVSKIFWFHSAFMALIITCIKHSAKKGLYLEDPNFSL